MTRIALISDQHICERKRFRECVRVLDWIVTDIAAHGVDLVLLGGDLFDGASTPLERSAAASWIAALADHAPVVGVVGNHEKGRGEVPLFERLRSRHGVYLYEEPVVHEIAGVAIACMPWPRKSALLASIGGGVGREQSEGAAREALRALLVGFGDQLDQCSGPRVLLAHAMVRGSRVSTGQELIGQDMEVGLEDLDLARAHVVALGHVHAFQEWRRDRGRRVVYPGSPYRTSFGELEPKGYALIDIELAGAIPNSCRVSIEHRHTPCAPMLDITGAWSDGGMRLDDSALDGLVVPPGALPEIRFRYVVPADQRELARSAAESIADDWAQRLGDAAVQIEPRVLETSTARAPEIAAAATVGEQLAVLWRTRGEHLSDERSERVLGLLADIEAEERASCM